MCVCVFVFVVVCVYVCVCIVYILVYYLYTCTRVCEVCRVCAFIHKCLNTENSQTYRHYCARNIDDRIFYCTIYYYNIIINV